MDNNRKDLDSLDPNSPNLVFRKLDIVTPHRMSLVMLVQQNHKIRKQLTEAGTPPSIESRRKFAMLLLKLVQYPDMSYKNLYCLITSSRYKVEKIVLESFEKCLSDLNVLGIEHLSDLCDFQTVIDKMLCEPHGITQYSIVGLYIRKFVLALDRMLFSETMALYKSILIYYEKGMRSIAISYSQDSGDLISEARLLEKDRNSYSKWSGKQADLFITQQSLFLETNERKALSPIQLQEKLKKIIHDNPLFTPAHFLNYMNCVRLRDFYTCLDALHRTFDRNPTVSSTVSEPRGLQYSSLTLTILHTIFGHEKEALCSLQECIMLAQERGDNQCLELANSWYCILHNKTIGPDDKTVPDSPDTASLSIQFIAKISALYGYRPSFIFELMLRSDELNSRNCLMDMMANSLAQRAALWTQYGENQLASLNSQILLNMNKTWTFGDLGNTEGACKVLSSLSLWVSLHGDYNLANVILDHARLRFPREPHSRDWVLCQHYINVNQAIYQCKWQEGMNSCSQLYILDKNIGTLQHAALLLAKRSLYEARQLLDELIAQEYLEPLIYVRALILQAYCMISRKATAAIIVQILTNASSFANERFLQYEKAMIDLLFTHVLLSMDMPQQALKTINSCIQMILSNGGIYDQAKAIFLYAKVLISSADSPEDKLTALFECTALLKNALENFKKLQVHSKVKDIYIFMAEFFNEIKLYGERNAYASKFKKYDIEFPTPYEYLDVFF